MTEKLSEHFTEYMLNRKLPGLPENFDTFIQCDFGEHSSHLKNYIYVGKFNQFYGIVVGWVINQIQLKTMHRRTIFISFIDLFIRN